MLQPMPTRTSCREPRVLHHDRSRLEVLPCEILFSVFEALDMASLINFSATTYLLRERVSAIPLMMRIRTSKVLTASFAAFLSTDKQKSFSLRDFGAALKSVHCRYCQEKTQFESLVNLMTCRRVCYVCFRKSKFCLPIPLKVAKSVLPLEADIERFGIVLGRADIHYSKRFNEDTDNRAFGKRERWIVPEYVLNLDAVMEPSCNDGGSEVPRLVNWLEDRLQSQTARHDPHSWGRCSPDDQAETSRSSWGAKEGDARMSCIAPLPRDPKPTLHFLLLSTIRAAQDTTATMVGSWTVFGRLQKRLIFRRNCLSMSSPASRPKSSSVESSFATTLNSMRCGVCLPRCIKCSQ
jgi:hypothetical protein